jgi:hypothetical protein
MSALPIGSKKSRDLCSDRDGSEPVGEVEQLQDPSEKWRRMHERQLAGLLGKFAVHLDQGAEASNVDEGEVHAIDHDLTRLLTSDAAQRRDQCVSIGDVDLATQAEPTRFRGGRLSLMRGRGGSPGRSGCTSRPEKGVAPTPGSESTVLRLAVSVQRSGAWGADHRYRVIPAAIARHAMPARCPF